MVHDHPDDCRGHHVLALALVHQHQSDKAIAEIRLIEDPHRAIDWLSTFPHVIALALGGDVDRPGEGTAAGPAATSTPGAPGTGSPPREAAELYEDSPFRILRGDR